MVKFRKWMLFWCLFIGIGAVFGGSCMLIDPSGRLMDMDAMIPYFQILPFAKYLYQDFVFPGIALLIVNGATQLLTAWLVWKKARLSSLFGACCGILLMLWICIQFVIFPLNFMSTVYFIFGLLQTILGILWLKEEKRA